jgi:choline dehydrogenase-like flavoprotein
VLHDARKVPAGTRIECDVCVIGAGAAGIALALELAGTSARVALLESGGFEREPATDDLSRGLAFGRAYPPLHEVRSRRFGGTTDRWLGLCEPLDPIDFEAREWVPHSGWPFDFEALRGAYERAQRLCGLEDFVYDGSTWANEARPALALDPTRFVTRNLQVAPTRFGEVHRAAVTGAAHVDTFLHANAVELRSDASGARLESVRVAVLEGGSFAVRARLFVLAAGGIENARLLLASNAVRPQGIGNEHDLVGRYFMEHPHLLAGALLPASADLSLALYQAHPRGRVSSLALLAPSDALLRSERILDFSALLASEGSLPELERALAATVHEIDAAASAASPRAWILLDVCEQAPNPESRVRLASERDALGVPRVRLEWRLSALDKRSLRRGHELLARELGRAGLGRLQLMLSDDDMEWPDDLGGGAHHMGTTRMHADPREGVVDANARVHGVANLFVAGSSVFPTSGAAHPTLTVVALALRLADHLKRILG